jgi:hypothetical protein
MKYKIELLVLLAISIGIALILPSFLAESKTIVVKSIFEFVVATLVIFTALILVFFCIQKIR